MRYKTKVKEIEAIQYTGTEENLKEVKEWLSMFTYIKKIEQCRDSGALLITRPAILTGELATIRAELFQVLVSDIPIRGFAVIPKAFFETRYEPC